jgi:hypothetical protein
MARCPVLRVILYRPIFLTADARFLSEPKACANLARRGFKRVSRMGCLGLSVLRAWCLVLGASCIVLSGSCCRGVTQAFLHFRTTNWTIHPTDYFFIRALVFFVVKYLLKSLADASGWDGTEWRMETEKWKNGENRG